jgi:glycosyltransferase involved in cell wall biosynthesis
MSQLLSIIIPCLNEEENVEDVLRDVTSILNNSDINYEVIVVDDQSSDATLHRAEQWTKKNPEFNVRVLYKELHRRGYGAAVKYGLAFANGEFAIFVSADLVDPVNLIPKMYLELVSGCDVAQVSRYLEKNNSKTIPFSYKFFQFFYRIGVRVALGQYIPDSTYAFKMFRRSKILAMGVASNRFNISPEIMFKSILAGLKVSFISGSQGVRVGGVSKFKFHKEGIGFGMCLIRAWLHRNRLIYWF